MVPGLKERAKDELESALARGWVVANRFLSELNPEFLQAVTDDATKGYPGLPGLAPAAGLERIERIVEARFCQLIADDVAGAIRAYRALAREDFGSDRYVNADLALSLLPEYAADKEFRTVFHRATYAPVSYLTRQLVVPEILKNESTGRPYALFLAGGPASGKSTVSKGALKKSLRASAVIVDSNLATMQRGTAFLDMALKAGLRPYVAFVYRPWEGVEQSVLSRLREQGRPISARTLAGNHYEAQQTFLSLAELYDGQADFAVFSNEGGIQDVDKKTLEFLRERSYAFQGENGCKEALARRFQEHVVREWRRGNLTTVEAIASGFDSVDYGGLGRLEAASKGLREEAREADASSEGVVET